MTTVDTKQTLVSISLHPTHHGRYFLYLSNIVSFLTDNTAKSN